MLKDKITTQEIAKAITEYEGLKEQVNIAQANEIARILPFILIQYSPHTISEWVHDGTVRELNKIRQEIDRLNQLLDPKEAG